MPPSDEARIREAVDAALLHGLLKYTPRGALAHAPFALAPWPIAPGADAALRALTPLFCELAWRVGRDLDFLEEALAPAARVDEFTDLLLHLARSAQDSQPHRLLIVRSDYFIEERLAEERSAGEAGPVGEPWRLRQVELNTVAASYAGLSGAIQRVHAALGAGQPWGPALIQADPLPGIAEAIAEAVRRHGHPQACLLMIVDAEEANVFDQWALEFALGQVGVPTVRATLAQVGNEALLQSGHLRLGQHVAAVTYFRSGYAPEQLADAEARRGRALIAAADTIECPDLGTQLGGAKKVQQLLADPATLRRFCSGAAATAMEQSFAAMVDPEALLPGPEGARPAWRVAMQNPEAWVLKPQREGGGNNLYDTALAQALAMSTPENRSAYILMERIRPQARRLPLLREGDALSTECISEIGRFGVLLGDGDTVLQNRDTGYLVRTKPADAAEGGVSAGIGFLNSLCLET